MLRLHGEVFYRATTALSSFRLLASSRGGKIQISVRGILKHHARALSTQLEALQANVTARAMDRLLVLLDGDACTFKDARKAIDEVDSRLRDELSSLVVFCLEVEKLRYFEPADPLFGQEVADKLPLAIPDIQDAGKCLSFAQGTATVFHLMRVMEAALKSLATLLGIPYAPSWESYITQIETKITAKHKTKSVKWKTDEPFYRDILGDLQAIKIAWRNPTMHIVRRYSPDEAEDIFRTVCTFLKRLAPRLPAQKT